MKQKLVIVGLDGVPYRLIKDLSAKGVMPATREILENGIFKQIKSTIPEVSSVAWSSIITGKNPGEHGIFGYTEIPQGTYRLTFPSYNDLKEKPFWENFPQKKAVIMNVPSTFPVRPINGVHISGFVSLDLERSVYPKSLIPFLKGNNYKIDVNASKAHISKELFIKDLFKTLEARKTVYRFLWRNIEWDIFMLVFTGTDRLSHFLWDAYENKESENHDIFLNHFRQIDEIIGEINSCLNEEDIFLLLSDHGFEFLEQEVNVNAILKHNSFLKLKGDGRRHYSDIDVETRAFALDPARIYLNLKNKYPAGSVSIKDASRIVEDLKSLFTELNYRGKKVVKRIFFKDQIYSGPFLEDAPDLILIPNQGFAFKSGIKSSEIYEKSIFTGKHTHEDAFFILNRKEILPEKQKIIDSVQDVGHLIKSICRLKSKILE